VAAVGRPDVEVAERRSSKACPGHALTGAIRTDRPIDRTAVRMRGQRGRRHPAYRREPGRPPLGSGHIIS